MMKGLAASSALVVMLMVFKATLFGCMVIALAIPALAQEAKQTESAKENPLAKYVAVPGAKTTLPVSAAKKPFPLEFVKDARARFENFHYQL